MSYSLSIWLINMKQKMHIYLKKSRERERERNNKKEIALKKRGKDMHDR